MKKFKSSYGFGDIIGYSPLKPNQVGNREGVIQDVVFSPSSVEGEQDENPYDVSYIVKNTNFGNIEQVPAHKVLGHVINTPIEEKSNPQIESKEAIEEAEKKTAQFHLGDKKLG